MDLAAFERYIDNTLQGSYGEVWIRATPYPTSRELFDQSWESGRVSKLLLQPLFSVLNWGSAKREKSFKCFLDDLQRCEQLGLELYNFQ